MHQEKINGVEKAYRKYGGGSKEHVKALRIYEKRVYGCYVSDLAKNAFSKKESQFKVHIGYTKTGRNRYRVFRSMKEASDFCSAVFDKTKIVLSIIEK